ncbi:MAG TPA: hypothetical protein DCX89_05070 [Saprospirales bacterium]|nr:hypothetical protein [Saprospirales bacterium]HAY71241.1 hypothetical protein [Saprospirales bacterium]HRQ30554.1 3'-5' exoribonuclease [Saprospiraceae bacterium]
MKSVQIFLDTEFTGLNQNAQLISLAMVAITGEVFYAEFNDFKSENINQWIRINVLTKLKFNHSDTYIKKESGNWMMKADHQKIQEYLSEWLKQFELIEVWADVMAYDWVLFSELFGGAMYTPDNLFFTPFDLSTLMRISGLINPQGKYQGDMSRAEFAGTDDSLQHNALNDAMTSMQCYKKLTDLWKNHF